MKQYKGTQQQQQQKMLNERRQKQKHIYNMNPYM